MTDLSDAAVCNNDTISDSLIHSSTNLTVNVEYDCPEVRLVNNNVVIESSSKLQSKLSSISFGSTVGSKSQLAFLGRTGRQYVPQKHGLCFISSMRSIPAFGFSTAPRFVNERGKAGETTHFVCKMRKKGILISCLRIDDAQDSELDMNILRKRLRSASSSKITSRNRNPSRSRLSNDHQSTSQPNRTHFCETKGVAALAILQPGSRTQT
jgi:hypothetical protein